MRIAVAASQPVYRSNPPIVVEIGLAGQYVVGNCHSLVQLAFCSVASGELVSWPYPHWTNNVSHSQEESLRFQHKTRARERPRYRFVQTECDGITLQPRLYELSQSPKNHLRANSLRMRRLRIESA